MAELDSIIQRLKGWSSFQSTLPPEERSSCLEYIIAEGLSHILRLPFYTMESDNKAVQNKVVWNGKGDLSAGRKLERLGGPDAYVYAYGYTILVEATQKTGKAQWTDEYARAIQHHDEECNKGARPQDLYLLFVPIELHQDSYTSIRQKCAERCCYPILFKDDIITILETYDTVCTATHIDLRRLLDDAMRACDSSMDVADFDDRRANVIKGWQKTLLTNEKYMFIGIRAYVALTKGRSPMASLSELFQELSSDTSVSKFYAMAGSPFNIQDISISLDRQRLAYWHDFAGDTFFHPVPLADIKGRIKVFLTEIENAQKQLCKTS